MFNNLKFLVTRDGFAIRQTLIVFLAAWSGWYWFGTVNARPKLPRFNNAPRLVRPQFDYPFVISDEQLAAVLQQLKPKFGAGPPKINFVDHALRLWGVEASFEDEALDGQTMQAMLLNHHVFQEICGRSAPPLLQSSHDGISVTTQAGRASVSHVDHLLGTIAEIGTPLDYPVVTVSYEGTVGDILEHALLNFQLNQREYEWTVLATALYAHEGGSWFTTEGQRIDFDTLALRMMRQPQPQGVCYGQHRLYTLAMLLRIDEQLMDEPDKQNLLSAGMRAQITSYLFDMTKRFYQTQTVQGYWDGNWPDDTKPVPDPDTDALSRRILATGHALEWWAMAPKALHPPRETIVRAAQWLTKNIVELNEKQVLENYTFLTHAARSLALWRGDFANELRNSNRHLISEHEQSIQPQGN